MKQETTNKTVRRFVILIIAFAVCLVTGGISPAQDDGSTETDGEWLTFGGNAARTGKSSLVGPPEEIELKWRWRVSYDNSPVSSSPAVDGSVVYAATEGGYAAAIDPDGGDGWVYNVDAPVAASPAVAADGSVMVITTDGYVYYFDAGGELQWKSEMMQDIAASPVISGSTAYVGTDDATMLALTLNPDMSGYEHESKKILRNEVISWSYFANGSIKTAPAFSGNTVFFCGGDYLFALNPNAAGSDNSSSLVKWRFDVNADAYGAPAVYGGRVYIGDSSGYLYALNENISSGEEAEYIWKRRLGGPIFTSPAIDERDDGEIMVYVGCDDGRLYAVSGDGELEWTYATLGSVRSSPAVDGNGDIYFGSDDGAVYALFPDGSLKWRYGTLGAVRSSPAIGSGSRLYVGSDDGYLYCIGEDTRETREPDLDIDVSLSLSAIENNGNPTEISAAITSESEGTNVLSRIASVEIDLSRLGLTGVTSQDALDGDNATAAAAISREQMLDDGLFEDDVAGDGVFTYVFGISNIEDLISYQDGIYTHYSEQGSLGVGPVPLMVTVTDLYGNRISKPFALNIVQEIVGTPAAGDTAQEPVAVTNSLSRQTLNITFTSGTPSILSVIPGSGSPGERVSISVIGTNTNFTKNRTRIEIFNNENFLIASAYPENDDVEVQSDTALNAVLNIVSTDGVTSGNLIGRWDVVVTTDFPSGGFEEVVGEDLFEISGSSSRTAGEFRLFDAAVSAYQDECAFELDITNASGARPDGAPFEINVGYSRSIAIDDARGGEWLYRVNVTGACEPVPTYKIVTVGSDFGYLSGEVKNGFTGEGIDNATVSAVIGDLSGTTANTTTTSGGGYYLLPLSSAYDDYTIIARKGVLMDIERQVDIENNEETPLNFSLKTDITCPVSSFADGLPLRLFYRFRDAVLENSTNGRRWIGLYYRHAPEVHVLLQDSIELRRQCRGFLRSVAACLPELLKCGTTSRDISHDAELMLDLLLQRADGALQRDLLNERDRILQFIQKTTKK